MLDIEVPIINHQSVATMTVDYAHLVMQRHRDCPITVCALKLQARNTLIAAKKMVPDSGRLNHG